MDHLPLTPVFNQYPSFGDLLVFLRSNYLSNLTNHGTVIILYSKTVTGKTKPLCDGKQSCSVPIVPTTELSIDEVISTKNNCPIDGELVKQVFVNYMLIKYECQGKCIGR